MICACVYLKLLRFLSGSLSDTAQAMRRSGAELSTVAAAETAVASAVMKHEPSMMDLMERDDDDDDDDGSMDSEEDGLRQLLLLQQTTKYVSTACDSSSETME